MPVRAGTVSSRLIGRILVLERLQEITYFAPDIEAYSRWMVEAAGAQVVSRLPNFIQLTIGPNLVTLHPSDSKGPTGPGGQVAYWRVAEMDAALRHFEAHGASRFRGPIQGVDGPTVAQVRDPWGNVWGLFQEPVTFAG